VGENANQEKLITLKEADFTDSIEINGTHYKLLKQVKTYQPEAEADAEQPKAVVDAKQTEHRFDLRRVVMLNMRTSQRVSVLCGDAGLQLTMRDIACGMLGMSHILSLQSIAKFNGDSPAGSVADDRKKQE
jgi:hypothetical protein